MRVRLFLTWVSPLCQYATCCLSCIVCRWLADDEGRHDEISIVAEIFQAPSHIPLLPLYGALASKVRAAQVHVTFLRPNGSQCDASKAPQRPLNSAGYWTYVPTYLCPPQHQDAGRLKFARTHCAVSRPCSWLVYVLLRYPTQDPPQTH